jgi:hypothetical protein
MKATRAVYETKARPRYVEAVPLVIVQAIKSSRSDIAPQLNLHFMTFLSAYQVRYLRALTVHTSVPFMHVQLFPV